MKLLLRSLLLASLCAISSWSVSGKAVVTQTSDSNVTEGDTVTITCCCIWKSEKIRFIWLINLSEIKNESFSLKNDSHYCSNLTLSNVTREDSGRYICEVSVEIPFYDWVEGNGTVITVTSRKTKSDNTDVGELPGHPTPVPIIIATAVMVPLFLITLACFCILRRRRAQAVRVIYEVPHIDSEVAEMDKHSTSSSRGSSQWCQVPVYESCDYFERVQTKESG